MYWLGVLVVSPIWAMLSTHLFLQGALACINFGIATIGLCRRAVALQVSLMAIIVTLLRATLSFALLAAGSYVLAGLVSLGQTRAEKNVYLAFCAFTVIYLAPQFIPVIKKQWRNCTIPGSLEFDIADRRIERARRRLAD
jgi:hypothetical protein